MTVQELIEELTRLKDAGFGETELVLSVTDHTDWTYNLDFPGFDTGLLHVRTLNITASARIAQPSPIASFVFFPIALCVVV